MASEGADEEFGDDDDDFADVPTQALTQSSRPVVSQVLSAGADEFEEDFEDNDLDAINQTIRSLSQAGTIGDIPANETIGAPIHHSTQNRPNGQGDHLEDVEMSNYPLNSSYLNNNSARNKTAKSSEHHRIFFGFDDSPREPSQEFEVLASDSDEE